MKKSIKDEKKGGLEAPPPEIFLATHALQTAGKGGKRLHLQLF